MADIFDVLTSHRPYKEVWSNRDAFKLLQELSGEELDSACVNALIENEDEVIEIQRQFQENIYG